MGVNISIYLDARVLKALDEVAQGLDRSRSWVVQNAIMEKLGLNEDRSRTVAREGFHPAK